MKRAAKRFIIRWEMEWYALTGLLFLVCAASIWFGAPRLSTAQLAVIQLFCGFTATVAAAASSIKSDDTEE